MPGPFYFAWVDNDEVEFDPDVHAVEDLDIFGFAISHQEGTFPTLQLDVRNPRVGLLAPGRKLWGYLSWDGGAGGLVPLFFGRLVGLPSDLIQEVIQLAFIAQSSTYIDDKLNYGSALKVRPFWDAIWIDPTKVNPVPPNLPDPDVVLEARSELWHIDRVTLETTTSDVLVGEDGLIVVDQAQVFYDSVALTFGEAPLRQINVTGTVGWTQTSVGTLDISAAIGPIKSFTCEGLAQSWPKPGTDIGGGWSVADGSRGVLTNGGPRVWSHWFQVDVFGEIITEPVIDANPGVIYSWATEAVAPALYGWHGIVPIDWNHAQLVAQSFSQFVLPPLEGYSLNISGWNLKPYLYATWAPARDKSEVVSFSLASDCQQIVTNAAGADIESISVTSQNVAAPIDPSGAIPIGDAASAVYFAGPRGDQSLEYLICLARAHLRIRSRAALVEFEVSFPLGVSLDLSCRKSVTILDARLPGGQATGKIIEYQLAMDGSSGQSICKIKIGCAVGHGGTVTTQEGTAAYVEDGYVNDGYTRRDGVFVIPVDGEVAYESLSGLPPLDDGVDFSRMTIGRCVLGVTITNDWKTQFDNMSQTPTPPLGQTPEPSSPGTVIGWCNEKATQIDVEMVPLDGGPFQTSFAPAVSSLMIPKLIDLEAGT